MGRARANGSRAAFVLLVHDWCKLGYDHPLGKRDLVQLTHETDVGYELTNALLVSAEDGSPLAAMEMHLKTGRGVLSTRDPAPTEHLAWCYYWRWRIESFFKLLKSHGQQLEQWQQETGTAIARRLLVATMACVVVWQLQADDSPPAREFKNILVRLSGRQMKRTRPHTAPALLAGLWVLLSMLTLLEHHNLRDLRRLAVSLIPLLDTG